MFFTSFILHMSIYTLNLLFQMLVLNMIFVIIYTVIMLFKKYWLYINIRFQSKHTCFVVTNKIPLSFFLFFSKFPYLSLSLISYFAFNIYNWIIKISDRDNYYSYWILSTCVTVERGMHDLYFLLLFAPYGLIIVINNTQVPVVSY